MLIGGKLQFFVKEYEGDKIGKKRQSTFILQIANLTSKFVHLRTNSVAAMTWLK